jgi:hypothetical protein
MADVSLVAEIAEPLFMHLDARVEFLPAMNVADLQKGLATAVQAK